MRSLEEKKRLGSCPKCKNSDNGLFILKNVRDFITLKCRQCEYIKEKRK